jgi:carboxyl-terminal processing protease
MKALVIDLRENPGGLLDAAVDAADLFLQRGVIVYTRGRNAHENVTHSAHEAGTWRVPLVLIIDQDSASAAEIFAGALHDHRRATLVGRRTYGKGSVQGIFPLAVAGAGVRLTTAKFYSPSGHPYSGVGVEPDIWVHQVARPASPGSAGSSPSLPSADFDPMLAAAVQAAQERIVQR